MTHFVVSQPYPDKGPGIALRPTVEQRAFLRACLNDNRFGSRGYELRIQAGAFLQSDSEDWLYIEFWRPGFAAFVDYLNAEFEPWVTRARGVGTVRYRHT